MGKVKDLKSATTDQMREQDLVAVRSKPVEKTYWLKKAAEAETSRSKRILKKRTEREGLYGLDSAQLDTIIDDSFELEIKLVIINLTIDWYFSMFEDKQNQALNGETLDQLLIQSKLPKD